MARSSSKAGRVARTRLEELAAKVQAARVAAGLAPPPISIVNAYTDDTPERIEEEEAKVAGAALIVLIHHACPRPLAATA